MSLGKNCLVGLITGKLKVSLYIYSLSAEGSH